jgi:metallo-beta-lactamase family protein
MPTKTTPPRNSKPANPKPFFVLHHGAKSTITGSCHEVKLGNTAILIDCGQFQGDDANGKNPLAIDFPVKHIKALIVTHAHIDHIGRIPWLLAAGFKGKIYATPATCELIPLMLEDGLKIQGINKHLRDSVIAQIKRQLHPLKFNQWHRIQISTSKPETLNSKQCLVPFIHTRLQPAGHILGSAYVELKLPNKEVIVFSGDLGPNNTPLLTDPKPPARADYLFIETTYGDKAHESVDSRGKRLKNIINQSIKDGGAIIIPAFSVGRTQELLFDIEQLIHEQGISGKIPIILDSPLASKVTRAYRRFRKLWKNEAKAKTEHGRQPLAFDQCIVVESYKQHLSIVNRLATTGEAQ